MKEGGSKGGGWGLLGRDRKSDECAFGILPGSLEPGDCPRPQMQVLVSRGLATSGGGNSRKKRLYTPITLHSEYYKSVIGVRLEC